MSVSLGTGFDNKEVVAFLRDLQSRLKYIEDGKKEYPALLSAIVYSDVMDHFKKEMGSGGKWPKWSKSYLDAISGRWIYRRINGRVVRISTEGMENPPKPPRAPGLMLQATGQLRNSFKPNNRRMTSAGILWYNDAKAKSGFPYAAAHDEGGSILPKRDFMWLSEDGMKKIEEQTLAYLLEKAGK